MKKIYFFVVAFLKSLISFYSISTKVAWRIKSLEYREEIRQDPSIAVLDKISYYKRPDWNSVLLLEMLIAMINELSDYLKSLHVGKQIFVRISGSIINFLKTSAYCLAELLRSPKDSE